MRFDEFNSLVNEADIASTDIPATTVGATTISTPPQPAAQSSIIPDTIPFRNEIITTCKKYNIPEWALTGLIAQESNFKSVQNLTGQPSYGLGQLHQSGAIATLNAQRAKTGEPMLTGKSIMNSPPGVQIDLIGNFLSQKIKRTRNNDPWLALILYNGNGDPCYNNSIEGQPPRPEGRGLG